MGLFNLDNISQNYIIYIEIQQPASFEENYT